MNTKIIMLLLLLASGLHSLCAQEVLRSSKGDWEVEISAGGAIRSLKMTFGRDKLVSVPWHGSGEYAGPSFGNVSLQKKGAFTYGSREVYPLSYGIRYAEEKGLLTLQLSLANNSGVPQLADDKASLCLGINTNMANPDEYFSVFFPTMLRCEKTHLWGYFEAPDGHVLGIASSDPIASWHLNYLGNGHRIASASLDLLHELPLPSRHPQDLFYMAPYETKTWKLVLLPLANIGDIPKAMTEATSIPVIDMARTTASAGELVDIHVVSHADEMPELTITGPGRQEEKMQLAHDGDADYHCVLEAPKTPGTYKILVEAGGYCAEASLYVRKPWGWYLRQAGKESMRMQQKAAAHREAWMGFFSAYWSQVYFPNPCMLEQTERNFERFWNAMVDPQTGFYYTNKSTWHSRPQNTSWMVGVLIARYAATGKQEHLRLAADWADRLIDDFQLPDGAYKGYTALTMGAKFIQELMWFESPLAKNDAYWKKRYEKHRKSVEAAANNLLEVKDMGDTEGEKTYEDNQAGSAWSLLAMHALSACDDNEKECFLKASLEVQKRHECLTQALIPDSRMRGGTLRWWEAQYDVLIKRNMMNSPHGWTMRSQFGAMYLYLLTGDEYFLNLSFNAMASCSQAIDLVTGELRWAFVPDPYVKIWQFVQDYRRSGEGKYVDEVIGEQWLPMISDWWRVPENEVAWNKERGWSCDNDVHEHFRFLAEMFIPNAFVIERADGSLRTWNCVAESNGGKIIVTPADELVTRVHFNLQHTHEVEVRFSNNVESGLVDKGLNWFGGGLSSCKVPAVYLWNEMIVNH